MKILGYIFWIAGIGMMLLSIIIPVNKYTEIGFAGNDCDGMIRIMIPFIVGALCALIGTAILKKSEKFKTILVITLILIVGHAAINYSRIENNYICVDTD